MRAFLDDAEDRGAIDESALDALATEHDLDDEEVVAVRAELEERDVEIVTPPQPTPTTSRCSCPPTRSACS